MSAGTNLYPSAFEWSSTYLATFWALPMAMMATWGLRMVGTKPVPPMFPTLEMLKVASSKSEAVSLPCSTLSLSATMSELICKILLSCTRLMLGTVRPSLESIAIEKLWSFLMTYSLM